MLVCVNTVQRAQDVYTALHAAGLSEEELLLIHSRYIFRDRNEKEAAIRDRCDVDVSLDARRPFALIATQVVEVSLNIDLHTIYTDPAPLEALLQRFGRVNRQCERGVCPVHVFREPTDGQGVYGRHKAKDQQGHIVRVTLAELEKPKDAEIDEVAINSWLDALYADPQLREQWETEYQQVAQNAASILDSLRPFNSDDTKEEEFEKMFDGVEVVPKQFEAQYIAHLINDGFIEASNYLVSISKQKFAMLAKKGLVQRAEAENKRGAWVARLAYNEHAACSSITRVIRIGINQPASLGIGVITAIRSVERICIFARHAINAHNMGDAIHRGRCDSSWAGRFIVGGYMNPPLRVAVRCQTLPTMRHDDRGGRWIPMIIRR